MANRYRKTSPVTGEIQIKTTVRCHFTPAKNLFKKKTKKQKISTDGDMQNGKLLVETVN